MTDEPAKTISVPAAGRRYFGIGKNASYAAAARGEIPIIRIGSRLRVPVIAMERMLVEAYPSPRAATSELVLEGNIVRPTKAPPLRGRRRKLSSIRMEGACSP
jgi:hypothetical protein